MTKSPTLTIWICIASLMLLPAVAHARTNAKWRIMQGTGDYANHDYKPITQTTKSTKGRN